MKVMIRKLFGLYPGEERNALLFAGLGFLWALAVTSGQKFADVLFLLHIGAESLPAAYAITAIVLMAMSAFFLKAYQKVHIQHVFIAVLVGGIFFYSFAYFCTLIPLGTESRWFWYLLKVFGAVFFALAYTCFWTFIDQYFHLQDAKRLYSLFSATVFLGIAATGFLMRSGWAELQTFSLMIVFLLVVAIFWIRRIEKTTPPVYDENALGSDSDVSGSFFALAKSILRSRFTLLLLLSNFLICVLSVTAEFSYMSAFDQYFVTETRVASGQEGQARLTQFLGQCVAMVSLFNLVFGLFFYSRIVRYAGMTTLVLITPLFCVLVFGGWTLSSILLFPILGFFIVEGMLYIFDYNNFTLLLNAVPTKIKYKVRLITEAFFEPVGMLVSSALIVWMPLNSKILGLILSALALVVAWLLRQHYLKAVFRNLAENAIHFHREVWDWFASWNKKEQQSAERRLLAVLKVGNESDQLLAIEALVGFENRAVLTKLLDRTATLSTPSKVAFIEIMAKSSFAVDGQFLDLLYSWLSEHPEMEVRRTIYFHLAKHGLLHPDKVYQDLESEDLILRGAAIMALKRSWAHLPHTAAAANRSEAAQYLQKLLESAHEEEICMGLTIVSIDAIPQDLDILVPFLKSPSIAIVRHAAQAIARVADKHSIRYSTALIACLESASDTDTRQACLRALGEMSDSALVKEMISRSIHFRPNERRLVESIVTQMGGRTVPILLSMVRDTHMHDRGRVLAGRILGRLALPQLRAKLYDIVSLEIERAHFYFYHHYTIQAANPELDLSVLRDALLSSYYSVLDFIIQLLGVAGESEDCDLLSRSLRSSNPKVRSHGLETLEKTCDPHILRALYPLIAELPLSERMSAYTRSGRQVMSLPELLDKMSGSSLMSDRLIAAALKYQLDLPNWREALRQQMTFQNEIFHHFAYELLET